MGNIEGPRRMEIVAPEGTGGKNGNQTVIHGNTAKFECRVHNSVEFPAIKWLRRVVLPPPQPENSAADFKAASLLMSDLNNRYQNGFFNGGNSIQNGGSGSEPYQLIGGGGDDVMASADSRIFRDDNSRIFSSEGEDKSSRIFDLGGSEQYQLIAEDSSRILGLCY